MPKAVALDKVTVTDPDTINLLCRVQQEFVEMWNHNEENWTHHPTDDHALPHGAEYSGPAQLLCNGKFGASFYLKDEDNTVICLVAVRNWQHWHEGWSFKRNPITPDKIRKVLVVGSYPAFEEWLAKLT